MKDPRIMMTTMVEEGAHDDPILHANCWASTVLSTRSQTAKAFGLASGWCRDGESYNGINGRDSEDWAQHPDKLTTPARLDTDSPRSHWGLGSVPGFGLGRISRCEKEHNVEAKIIANVIMLRSS